MMAPTHVRAQRRGFPIANILWLDLTISIAIVAVVIGVLLPMARHAPGKASFSEVLMQFRPVQIALVERMAVEGNLETDVAEPGPPGVAAGQYKLSFRVEGESFILAGKHPHSDAPFSLAIAPSIIRGEPSGSVNWLCGQHGASAGWTGPTHGPGTDLQPSDTPFVCKARSGSTQP
jgi:hypothetical protein